MLPRLRARKERLWSIFHAGLAARKPAIVSAYIWSRKPSRWPRPLGLARHCEEGEGRRTPPFRDGMSASDGEPRNDEPWYRCACASQLRPGCVIALSRSEEALLKSRMARAVFTAAFPRTTTAPARPIRRSRRECRPRPRQAPPPRRSRAQPRRPRPGPRSRDCGAHPSPST